MKRLAVAVIILAVLAGANMYTRSLLDDTGAQMLNQVQRLEDLVREEKTEKLEEECRALQQQWLDTEEVWSRFLRNDRLDAITIAAARLPELARYEEKAEVSASLCEIGILLRQTLDFESPRLMDIL